MSSDPGEGPAPATRFAAEVVARPSLDPADRAGMLLLLQGQFAGVRRARFEADLEEKDWVVLLRDRERGTLAGFSTLQRFVTPQVPGVVAFFSGDTIVERRAWREQALLRAWARLTFARAAAEQAEAYWLLICSGFRTYRFLPVFFREFYPRHDGPGPARLAELAGRLAAARMGGEYSAARGVVRFREPCPLRAVPEPVRHDPHVAFFERANPGHAAGDELVCLARLHPDNLTAAGRRVLGPP